MPKNKNTKEAFTKKIRCYSADRRDTKLKAFHKERDKALKKTSSSKLQAKILNKYWLSYYT